MRSRAPSGSGSVKRPFVASAGVSVGELLLGTSSLSPPVEHAGALVRSAPKTRTSTAAHGRGLRSLRMSPFRSMGFVSVIIVSALFALGLPLVLL